RLFVRRDAFGRFFSCLVFLPRDRFNTVNRRRIEEILQRAFGATSVDYETRVSESVLARLHYVLYVEPGRPVEYDAAEIEQRLGEATREWTDEFRDALTAQLGEARAGPLFERYRDAFPGAYREDFRPRSAVLGVNRVEKLESGGLGMSLYMPHAATHDHLAFKLLRARLTSREITVLRAIAKYLRQAGSTFSQDYMEDALAAHPTIARSLVELFHLRLGPTRFEDTDAKAAALDLELEAAIDEVPSLDEDRILSCFLRVVRAVLRTNYFHSDADGQAE